MIYAPILITTVSRYEHLKMCLDSLAGCTWANFTDVFIAVDFPGKKEHWAGYCKIREYLDGYDSCKFNMFNVVYRETNYFYSGKGNLKTLREEVFKKYDRVIISEDDNVFSPNFLVYMNKALEKFKDDKTVLGINGYKHFYPVKFKGNTFYRQSVDFSVWGYGIWRDRYDLYVNHLTRQYLKANVTIKTMLEIRKMGNNRLVDFLKSVYSQTPLQITDSLLSVLMAIERLDVIVPKESLVRNLGWDGSGNTNIRSLRKFYPLFNNQAISVESDFSFKGTGWEYYEENKSIYRSSSIGKISDVKMFFTLMKVLVGYLGFRK